MQARIELHFTNPSRTNISKLLNYFENEAKIDGKPKMQTIHGSTGNRWSILEKIP
jgi:hypothetical protein